MPLHQNVAKDFSKKRDSDSGVTTAPATPAMQGGGTLGGRHITKLTDF